MSANPRKTANALGARGSVLPSDIVPLLPLGGQTLLQSSVEDVATAVGESLGLAGMATQTNAGMGFTDNFQGSGNGGIALTGPIAVGNLAPGALAGRDWNFVESYQYSGGSPGTTQGPVGAIATAGENVLNYIWTALFVLFDKGPSTGQNVGLYTQATKQVRSAGANGTTGALVAEMIDLTTDPAQGSVGFEVDLRVTGTDVHSNRCAVHHVYSTPAVDNASAEIYQGIKHDILGTGMKVHRFIDFGSATASNNDYLFIHTNSSLTPDGVLSVAGFLVSEAGVELNRPAASPPTVSRLNLQIDGATAGFVQQDSSSQSTWGLATGNGVALKTASLEPLTDNAITLGASAKRWSTVYAGTGTINTSDASQKTPPVAFDDAQLDAIGDVALVAFQYKDAVEAKGPDAARRHAGAVAQQLAEAYRAHGLDPARYGVFCADPELETVSADQSVRQRVKITVQVPKEDITVENGVPVLRRIMAAEERNATDQIPVVDETGDPVIEPEQPETVMVHPVTGVSVVRPGRPAMQRTHPVDRYETVTAQQSVTQPKLDADGKPVMVLGLRYQELSILLHAWTRRELVRVSARLAKLEPAS